MVGQSFNFLEFFEAHAVFEVHIHHLSSSVKVISLAVTRLR